jgi:hypothetical protein
MGGYMEVKIDGFEKHSASTFLSFLFNPNRLKEFPSMDNHSFSGVCPFISVKPLLPAA